MRTMNFSALRLFALICLATAAATSPALAEETEGASTRTTTSPAPGHWKTSHSIDVGGETVEYDAVVTGIQLENDDGAAAAQLWYTAYFRTNGRAPRERPLVFSYNGGPGSASFWLHMGIMGPRRVVTPDVGPQGAPPYPLEDNAWTILDIADIVMSIRSAPASATPWARPRAPTTGASTRTRSRLPSSSGVF